MMMGAWKANDVDAIAAKAVMAMGKRMMMMMINDDDGCVLLWLLLI